MSTKSICEKQTSYSKLKTNLVRGQSFFQVDWIWMVDLESGRLFEVGANSRLGAYSNKYGIFVFTNAHC